LYSAVASAVIFSPEVNLKGFENKPGWVFKNIGNRIIRRIQIPEPMQVPEPIVTVAVETPVVKAPTEAVAEKPASVVTEEPAAVVTEDSYHLAPVRVIITYADGRAEELQVEPRDTFDLPPGATAQIIVAEAMGDEVAALWDDVDFNLARGLVNLLPVPRTIANLFAGDGQEFDLRPPPARVLDPSLIEEGGLRAVPEEERLLAQLKQIQIEKERAVRAAHAERLAEETRRSERAKRDLDEIMEAARQAAQEEYDRRAREAAAQEEELRRHEQEAVTAQDQEPAMKACLEGFFRAYEQLEGAKKMQVLEMRNLCRVSIVASAELKQIREALARNKKVVEDAEIARAAAVAKAEREAAAAKLKIAQEASIAQEHIERELAAVLERVRASTVSSEAAAVLVRDEMPKVKQESSVAAASASASPSPAAVRKGSVLLKKATQVFSMLDYSGKFLGNDTRKDGDDDGHDSFGGGGGYGSLLATTTTVVETPQSL